MLNINNIYNFKVIGSRIKEARTNSSLTQEDLGNRVGVSRWTVAGWEKGDKMPEMAVMLNLCNLFSCELGYLLCEHDTKTRQAADICEETGLSEESVAILVSAQKNIQHGDTWTGTYGELAVDGLDYNQVLIRLADGLISCCSIENTEPSIIDHICKYLLILIQKNTIYNKESFSPYRKIYRDCTRKNLYTDSRQGAFANALWAHTRTQDFQFRDYEQLFRECDSIITDHVELKCLGQLNREEEDILLSMDFSKRFRSLEDEFPESPRSAGPLSKKAFYLRPYLEGAKSPWDFLEKVTCEIGKLLFTVFENTDNINYAQLDVTKCFDEIVKQTFKKE